MASGETSIKEKAVKSTYTQYSLDPVNLTIVEKDNNVCARKIPFIQIREKLLQQHEELGLLCIHPDEYFDNVQETETQATLQKLSKVHIPEDTTETLHEKLKFLNRQKYFKMWHDHSTIGGHSHFMVLFSPIYNPAFCRYFYSS